MDNYLTDDVSELTMKDLVFTKNTAPNFGASVAISRHWGYRSDSEIDDIANTNPAIMDITMGNVQFIKVSIFSCVIGPRRDDLFFLMLK